MRERELPAAVHSRSESQHQQQVAQMQQQKPQTGDYRKNDDNEHIDSKRQ